MNFKLYLAVGGEAFDASAFQERASVPGARVRRVGHRGQQIDPTRFREWNVWESPRLEGSNDPGDDVGRLIASNARALTILGKESRGEVKCWVGIVGYYCEGEAPRGFSFDAGTIRRLAEIGASIEIDVVYDTAEILKHQGAAGPQ
jgi:hypothetical protein